VDVNNLLMFYITRMGLFAFLHKCYTGR